MYIVVDKAYTGNSKWSALYGLLFEECHLKWFTTLDLLNQDIYYERYRSQQDTALTLSVWRKLQRRSNRRVVTNSYLQALSLHTYRSWVACPDYVQDQTKRSRICDLSKALPLNLGLSSEVECIPPALYVERGCLANGRTNQSSMCQKLWRSLLPIDPFRASNRGSTHVGSSPSWISMMLNISAELITTPEAHWYCYRQQECIMT